MITDRQRAIEALHNLITLAIPWFSDDTQMLALSEAAWLQDCLEEQPKPAAWLIRETRNDRSSIVYGHMFKNEGTAKAAAERMSTRWGSCVAVPVAEIEA